MSTGNTPAFINKEQYGRKKVKKSAPKKPAAKKPMKKGKGY